jgi:hypothetical protein
MKGRLLSLKIVERVVVRTRANTVKIGSVTRYHTSVLQTDVVVPLRFDAGYTAAMSLDSLNPSRLLSHTSNSHRQTEFRSYCHPGMRVSRRVENSILSR